jgi:hypothetical protein
MMISQIAGWIGLWYLSGLFGAIIFLPVVKTLNFYVTVGDILRVPLYAMLGPVMLVIGCCGYVAIAIFWLVDNVFSNIDFDKIVWK